MAQLVNVGESRKVGRQTMADAAFRITDTQDGRFAVEDEKGFVLERLTKEKVE